MYTRLSKAEVETIVKDLRKTLPPYNNDRRVVITSEFTKKGEKLLQMASRYDGQELSYCYKNPSPEKLKILDDLYQMYIEDWHSEAFSICAHNCHSFSVSWINRVGVVYITRSTEYIIVCAS